MSKVEGSAVRTGSPGSGRPSSQATIELSEEDRSKDEFFVRLADVAEAMIKRHGKDFTMGALLLTARFIAEDKPLAT